MHSMRKEDPGKVLVAAAIGFAVGVLLAPRSGRETREQLRVQADEVKSRAKLVKEDLHQHVREGRDQLRDATHEVKRRAKDVKEDIRTDVQS